jgi:hypothetical protein
MTTSALPSETRPIRMDPELAVEIEKILKPLKGDDLERGRAAVMVVYRSSASGSFGQILEAYRTAIEEAVTAP